ncbi:MAG: c-type cytochrome domain-containing protein, partial [Vicinamibacterales bacterium]
MVRTTFWATAATCALVSAAAVLGAAQSQPVRPGAAGPATPAAAKSPVARAPVAQARVDVQPVVNRYCLSCHSDRLKTGGLTLENRDYTHPAADAELWEKVVRKLNAGMMPPPGSARPDSATLRLVASALSGALD